MSWTHAALNSEFMFSLKTQVSSAPHQPGDWNRVFRAAGTLQRISTLTQVYSLCQVRSNCPSHTQLCVQTHTRSEVEQHPSPKERSPVCYWWEHELWRGWEKGRCVQTLIQWMPEVSLEMLAAGVSPGQPRGSILICRNSQLGSAWGSANKHKWTRCYLFYPLKKKGNSLSPQGQAAAPQAHEFQLCGFQWPEIQVLRDTMWLFRTYMLHLTTKICF